MVPVQAPAMLRCVSHGVEMYVSERIDGAKCSTVAGVRTRVAIAKPATHAAVRDDAAPASAPKASSPRAAPASPLRVRQRQATLYFFVKDGVPHYLSRRPAGVTRGVEILRFHYMETCYLCAPTRSRNAWTVGLDTSAYQAEVAAASREFGVGEALIRAVIHAESAFEPRAVSRVGAQGLMQLMPGTARRFGVADAFDAAQNIRGGVQYLAWLLRRFDGDLVRAVAGYNAGEGAVDRHGGLPPYAETQRFVQTVTTLEQRYRSRLETARP
ncbi:lytic transglycosylase domain-containing protein [Lysobacter arvi]